MFCIIDVTKSLNIAVYTPFHHQQLHSSQAQFYMFSFKNPPN